MILKDLKLDWPLDTQEVGQGFGKNAVDAYSRDGLKGHSGIDFLVNWGEPIYSASKGLGIAYKAFNKDNKDLSKYRAACELIELEDCVVELTYGHDDQILCVPGPLLPRQQIATVGNTGEVYYGTTLVTTEEKLRGSKKGAHLHFQMRVCFPKSHTDKDDYTLQDGEGMTYIHNGNYLTYKQNGYNGCVDPIPYFEDSTVIEKEHLVIRLASQVIDLLNKLILWKKQNQ